MSQACRITPLALFAFSVLMVGVVLHVMAMAFPSWMIYKDVVRFGLFRTCLDEYDVCTDTEGTSTYKHGFRVCRAFSIIGAVLSGIAGVLSAVSLFGDRILQLNREKAMGILSAVLIVGSCISACVTLGVWLGEIYFKEWNMNDVMPSLEGKSPSDFCDTGPSMWLEGAAIVALLFAGVLSFARARQVDSSPRKQPGIVLSAMPSPLAQGHPHGSQFQPTPGHTHMPANQELPPSYEHVVSQGRNMDTKHDALHGNVGSSVFHDGPQ